MICSENGSVSGKKKRDIMKEIVKGQKAAIQLKMQFQKPFGSEPSLSSHQLMANVLTSFTQSLSIINSSSSSSKPASADGVARRNLLSSGKHGSPVTDSGNDPTSGYCSKKRSQKSGRGRYNRRKGAVAWTRLSSTTDDDHAWRKYGQKEIQNSEFPRSYFRCSYKYDLGCQATKQVQQDQDNPCIYRTIYIGIHTCNSDRDTNVQDHLISSQNLTIKPEFPKESHTSSDLIDHKLMDPSIWSDLKDSEPSKPTIVPLRKESDNNADNVYSCTDSQNLDMDFGGVASIHFGTHSHFDKGAVTGMIKTKQVQLDQENPNMYQTTNIGFHLCNDMSTQSEIGYTSAWEPYLLNFDHESEVPNVQDHHISSPKLTTKQDLPKEDTPSDATGHKLDPNLWIDYWALRDEIYNIADNMDFGVSSLALTSTLT